MNLRIAAHGKTVPQIQPQGRPLPKCQTTISTHSTAPRARHWKAHGGHQTERKGRTGQPNDKAAARATQPQHTIGDTWNRQSTSS